MVSRPIWQRMLEWVQTSTPGDTESAGGKTEEASEEQASKDPAQAQSLIAREHARSGHLRLPEPDWTNKLRILFLAGAAFLIALAALVAGIVAGVVFVVHNAARLKLPWPPAGTSTLTLAVASLLGATAWRVGQAILRRRAVRATAQNPPESRTEDDQNPVAAP
ncbi:hypothetical protein OG739_36710 [Streptomyces longwoodensis]|uniref:hypothetical protein n=1 Tax=Streptomyces longwoodensis TaxID=68231 RepID=UPI0022520306|nr:hypothetical protein [Streptomyces longwoodensis]MCX5000829.1 hypothetical protein [Streptomyces longwoodensis]